MANFRAELLDQPVVEAAATVALAYRDLPDGTIVEHMDTLESLGIVRTYPVVPYLIYTLAPLPGTRERLLRAVLDAVRSDPAAQHDRAAALDRSRSRFETRVRGAVMNAS